MNAARTLATTAPAIIQEWSTDGARLNQREGNTNGASTSAVAA